MSRAGAKAMMQDPLPVDPRSIRIVLAGTTHPGNIGAAARAMKTMGLSTLYLVAPGADPLCEEAVRRAAGAEDILHGAKTVPDLLPAIAQCGLVFGTSARARAVEWPTLDAHTAAGQLVAAAASGPVALLFGPERNGLSNVEVERCSALVSIPANPAYSSLNLASAVQILAYEIRRHLESPAGADVSETREQYADPVQLDGFYQHLARTLEDLEFVKSSSSRKLLRKFTRLFNRARLRAEEVDMLRGVLTAAQSAAGRDSGRKA